MSIDYLRQPATTPKRIAVIGSGISGLAAAWLLSKRHRVTLFEADERPGGHAHTVMAPAGDGEIAVDTGFIVYNERNYPNLTALFAHLGVATKASDMSFAASLDGGRMEYSSAGLAGLLGQRSNTVSLRFWAMLRDIGRFYLEAPRLLARPQSETQTLGQYLDTNGYSAAFVEDHLLPMGAAIWSTTTQQMRDYPLVAFVRFFVHHGLLDLFDRPKWRTVRGGSREYVARLVADIAEMRLATPVRAVTRSDDGATVVANGVAEPFDAVVLATHADQALRLLGDASGEERMLLGAFGYTDNEAVLHTDTTLMPRRRRVWSSWNYIGETAADDGERPLCVTYWMNRLQRLDAAHELFVTLNPVREIAAGQVIRRFRYRHPLFDQGAVEAQQHLWRLQGERHVYFAGSYFGHGFHEDALQAGLAAAEAIGGVRRPWTVSGASDRIAQAPRLEAAE